MINLNSDASERFEYLKKQIDRLYTERALAFSQFMVMYSTPDRYSNGDVHILNIDKMNATFEEFRLANEKLIRLVQEYNNLARYADKDIIQLIIQG